MGLITKGVTIACQDRTRRAGIKKLFLANKDDITSFTTGAGHSYSTVTMSGTAVFFEFEFERFTASYNGESTRENGSVLIEHVIEAFFPTLEGTKGDALQEAIDSCGLVAIIELFDKDEGSSTTFKHVVGFDEVLGDEAFLEANANALVEAELQGQNGFLLNLAGFGGELAREYTGVIPV